MKLSTLPLLLAALMLPSCSTLTNAQRDINEMTVSQYTGLKTKVYALTAIASNRIAKDWDVDKRSKALGFITNARTFVTLGLGDLDVVGVIRTLANRYAENMGLDAQARSDIQNAALLIDAVVGPIKIGIDGKLGERELGLVLALLDGLQNGLNR